MSHRLSTSRICLDTRLIATAKQFITGANVHRVKQMIFLYEQAVCLHNGGWPSHRTYQREYEAMLREFILQESLLRSKFAA